MGSKLMCSGIRRIGFILGTTLLLYLLLLLSSSKTDKIPQMFLSLPSKSNVSTTRDRKKNPDMELFEGDGQLFLNPPSQDWVHDQLTKTLHFLHLPKRTYNTWKECRIPMDTYFFPTMNTLFTGIPKSGSSNWLEALLRAEGTIGHPIERTRVFRVHRGLKQNYDMRSNSKNNVMGKEETAFSFAVVRNPWTRMVSGYRDKLSDEVTQGYSFRPMGIKIVREMRGVTDPDLLKTLYPSFEEYLRYLVLKKATNNDHFMQQWKTLCIPQINYRFMVPLEYSSVMAQEVWSYTNTSLSHVALLGSYDSTTDPRAQSSALLAKKWYSEMDEVLINDLYELFRADFMLMNYSNFSHPNFPLPIF